MLALELLARHPRPVVVREPQPRLVAREGLVRSASFLGDYSSHLGMVVRVSEDIYIYICMYVLWIGIKTNILTLGYDLNKLLGRIVVHLLLGHLLEHAVWLAAHVRAEFSQGHVLGEVAAQRIEGVLCRPLSGSALHACSEGGTYCPALHFSVVDEEVAVHGAAIEPATLGLAPAVGTPVVGVVDLRHGGVAAPGDEGGAPGLLLGKQAGIGAWSGRAGRSDSVRRRLRTVERRVWRFSVHLVVGRASSVAGSALNAGRRAKDEESKTASRTGRVFT